MEIESLDALDRALARSAPLAGLRLQGLDLRGRAAALLARTDLEGLVVLGGQLTPELEHHLRRCRALIFPNDPHAPVDPYRATLYRPEELYAGLADAGYAGTPDARAYRWSRDASTRSDVFVTLLRAIHDDSMSDALDELVAGRSVVGRHGRPRHPARHAAVRRGGAAWGTRSPAPGSSWPPEAAPARWRRPTSAPSAGTGRALDGGPGPPRRGAVVRRRTSPPGRPSRCRCGRTPHRRRAPRRAALGVPTWFYGHEPPNVFVRRGSPSSSPTPCARTACWPGARAGVVVLPGAAGTVQEVFQAATRLYYGRGAGRPRSCSSARGTGPGWSPCGTPCRPSARTGACRAPYTWWTRRRRRWPCSAGRPAARVAPDAQAVAAASWPQAPSISWPRVSRTVVGMPCARSRSTNCCSSPGREAVHFEPGVGLSGIRLTCTQPRPRAVQHVAEQVGPPGLVVDVADQGVLDARPGARCVSA